MNAVECGAACLAMILAYHGRQTPLAECSERLGIGRDGVTAQSIVRAARTLGLRVRAFSAPSADFTDVPLPAIAHWNFDHFVVVERWSPERADIIDPAEGRRSITADQFDAAFTGVVLTFETAVQFAPRTETPRPLLLRYLTSLIHRPRAAAILGQILAASALLQAIGLALPLLTKVLVDQVIPYQLASAMPLLGAGTVILVAALMVIGYLRGVLLIYLQGRLDSEMTIGLFEHILSLPFRFFQLRNTGDLLMRLGSTTMIRETLTNRTVSAVLDGAFVLVYFAILLFWHPIFALLVLGIGSMQVALLFGSTRRLRHLMERDLAASAASQSYLAEVILGIATVKAAGAEERVIEHWSNLFFTHLNISLERGHLSVIVETAMITLRTLSPLALLWVGAQYVLDGGMSLGTMLALNALAASVLLPLASLVSSGQQLQLVRAHLERLADVADAEPEQDLKHVQAAPPCSGKVELRHVSFRYDAQAPQVLRDITVTIGAGQKVALVGRTGSGKSTLAKLLLGLYTPSEGDILYEGIPAQYLDYSTLRRQFGVVLQDLFLFSGSIRQNIALPNPGLSLEQVMKAARLAQMHDEIMAMPMGYETIVAEGGSALSGGQRQRLALARALVCEPAILLLDEATSHLDVLTEQAIEENLNALRLTRIVIAHRLSTIRNADLILVLDKGAVVERGSHDGLLAMHGRYAELIHSQWQSEAGAGTSLVPAVVRQKSGDSRFDRPA
jgi:HlyB family type I secretion system ABC transporter